MPSNKFTRDSAGLTEMLFCTMEELRAGLISPKQAGVIAMLADAQLRNVAMALEQQKILNDIEPVEVLRLGAR